nr:MAG TPA: hypothetical protein [Caudoviricetes sp.]DAX98798.1 MAG TPA: hypothetical protein [Caudoviricetes sp.]
MASVLNRQTLLFSRSFLYVFILRLVLNKVKRLANFLGNFLKRRLGKWQMQMLKSLIH